MRDIKFRGKCMHTGSWIYGNLLKCDDVCWISIVMTIQVKGCNEKAPNKVTYEVRSETVGQYTGLEDKNEKEIYEGDIVRVKSYGNFFNVEVNYVQYGYLPFRYINEKFAIGDIDNKECLVLGNIYENSDLFNQ